VRHSGSGPGGVGLLAWVLAVVATGLVAGRAVAVLDTNTSRPGVMSLAEVDRALVAARAAVPTPSPTASAATTTPAPSASPTASPSVTDRPTPEPTTAITPNVPAAVARTWSVTGGTVAASCTGSTISLLFATPADGWTVEVGGAGPERIEVELKRPGSERKVVALCAGGVPQQTVGDGGSDAAGGQSSDG